MSTLINNEDPEEMLHNAFISSGSTPFAKAKMSLMFINTLLFEKL